jgi:putative transposase
VTFERKRLLVRDATFFLPSWKYVKPIAWVLVPDHFHALVTCGEFAIYDVMYDFKLRYRYKYEARFGSGRIWQHRFWDHIIRDEEDFLHHLDYIHFNPVKHGLAQAPGDYQHSSFREWEAQGYYDDIQVNAQSAEFDGNFGE